MRRTCLMYQLRFLNTTTPSAIGFRPSEPRCHSYRLELDRLLEREVEPCFGRNLNLLSLGQNLDAAAYGCARSRADGRAFASAGQCADNRAQRRCAADHFSGLGAARAAGLGNIAGSGVD